MRVYVLEQSQAYGECHSVEDVVTSLEKATAWQYSSGDGWYRFYTTIDMVPGESPQG